MKYFGEGFSERHKELSTIIRKKECVGQAKELFLSIHEKLHLSTMAGGVENETDRLLQDLTRKEYGIMPGSKDETIAWVIWHIARIEDLTMNVLVGGREQVFNEEWMSRMHIHRKDTGNAFSDDEIMELSGEVNIKELLNYRNEVGRRTREIVSRLTDTDMRRKVRNEDLERIHQEGGVTDQEDSIWLLDFWGKKDVAGLLLMPPTRHVVLHLNSCGKWKEEIRKRKKFFRTI